MAPTAWRYLDKDYYSAQAGRRFSTTAAAFRHYQRHGCAQGLDPHRYFATAWYQWQNPDWRDGFADPLSHFIFRGAERGADPSYLVDMARFRRRTAGGDPVRQLFRRGGLLTEGVYSDLSVLPRLQSQFLRAIRPVPLRVTPPVHRRSFLIHLQAGASAAGKALCDAPERRYDVLMNYYQPGALDPSVGEYAIFQTGTKFTAAYLIHSRFPQIYRDYRYVLFLDDDIGATPEELNRLFILCERYDLALGQASLTAQSHCVWPHLFRRGESGVRYLNAVEIMMPVMSARALSLCAAHFADSISGFGLDLLYGHLVESVEARSIAVLDDVALRHAKPIDEATGAYYEFLRANQINPKAELWRLISLYRLDRDIRMVG